MMCVVSQLADIVRLGIPSNMSDPALARRGNVCGLWGCTQLFDSKHGVYALTLARAGILSSLD